MFTVRNAAGASVKIHHDLRWRFCLSIEIIGKVLGRARFRKFYDSPGLCLRVTNNFLELFDRISRLGSLKSSKRDRFLLLVANMQMILGL